jgi:RNA 2',3'-cyclic 3'-phosphodiesterase
MGVTRAFVALCPPAAVLDAVSERAVEVAGARMMPRETWHITVQFFGDCDLDAVVAALSGLSAPAGTVQLGGASAFPRKRRASYLVLSLAAGAEWLAGVADAVAACVAPLGIEREAREFRPHLTLARLRSPRALDAECAAVGSEPVGPAWRAEELAVFESHLRPSGAEHLVRATLPLGP